MSTKISFASIRHLLLHFDLNTTKGERSATYRAIKEISTPAKPQPLTGSVFLIHIPEGTSPISQAYSFWSALAAATKSTLVEGDAFFLHMGGFQAGYMDVLYQTVDSSCALDPKPETTILESLFLKR